MVDKLSCAARSKVYAFGIGDRRLSEAAAVTAKKQAALRFDGRRVPPSGSSGQSVRREGWPASSISCGAVLLGLRTVVDCVRRMERSSPKRGDLPQLGCEQSQKPRGERIVHRTLSVAAAFCIVSFANLTEVRSDLLDYGLVVDGVYTDSTEATYVNYSVDAKGNIDLPVGATLAYVAMAIIAQINNPSSSTPISTDGISEAALNIVGNDGIGGGGKLTTAGAGGAEGQAIVNNQDSYNLGLENSYGSPVQGYMMVAGKGTTRSPYVYGLATSWPVDFMAPGYQNGTASSSIPLTPRKLPVPRPPMGWCRETRRARETCWRCATRTAGNTASRWPGRTSPSVPGERRASPCVVPRSGHQVQAAGEMRTRAICRIF